MIKLEIFIPPFRLAELRETLDDRYSKDLMITPVHQVGYAMRGVSRFRGVEYSNEFSQLLKVEVWADDDHAANIATSLQVMLCADARNADTCLTKQHVERCIVIGD
jgi:nitrogen regulatory protein PII